MNTSTAVVSALVGLVVLGANSHGQMVTTGGGGGGMVMGQAGGGGEDVFFKTAGAGDKTLVLPKDSAPPGNLAEAEEDLNVMGRILEKAAGNDEGKAAMGIFIPQGLFGGRSGPRNLYIEGYGALFFLNVNYPLVAPHGKKAEAEPKDERSSEWDQARRELYQSAPGLSLNLPGNVFEKGGEPYSSERVDNLKANLVAALKNAAHIRALRRDEVVTIVIGGRAEGESRRVVTHSDGKNRTTASVTHRSDGERGGRMVVRATRADIEAFQKGRLDEDAFAKKVTVMLY